MRPGVTMRVARPTDNLAAIAAMYAQGLGFLVLDTFTGHQGFDGIILGHPDQPWHLEFTSRRGHQAGRAPSDDHLLVFYLPDREEWEAGSARMLLAGFRRVPSGNPYWETRGRTFEDLDGYRVVLQQEAWPAKAEDPAGRSPPGASRR